MTLPEGTRLKGRQEHASPEAWESHILETMGTLQPVTNTSLMHDVPGATVRRGRVRRGDRVSVWAEGG